MVFGIFGKKKTIDEKKRTFHIIQGNVDLDSSKIEALRFAIDEGFSDQAIIDIGKAVTQELARAEKSLGEVV